MPDCSQQEDSQPDASPVSLDSTSLSIVTVDSPQNVIITDEYRQRHISNMLLRLEEFVSDADAGAHRTTFSASVREHHMRPALYQVLCEMKESMRAEMPMSPKVEDNTLIEKTAQAQKLNELLADCMAGAEMGPPSPDCDGHPPVDEEQYRKDFNQIQRRFNRHTAEIEKIRKITEKKIDTLMETQRELRPISKSDHRKLRDKVLNRYNDVEHLVKRDTCSNIMLINSKCLESSGRRRRNFPKETTAILVDFYNSHADHPYPTEDQKQQLAKRCGMTIQQVSNWFGNRRIRCKKAGKRLINEDSIEEKNGENTSSSDATYYQPKPSQSTSSRRTSEATDGLTLPIQQNVIANGQVVTGVPFIQPIMPYHALPQQFGTISQSFMPFDYANSLNHFHLMGGPLSFEQPPPPTTRPTQEDDANHLSAVVGSSIAFTSH